jgi:hypothetical protein
MAGKRGEEKKEKNVFFSENLREDFRKYNERKSQMMK